MVLHIPGPQRPRWQLHSQVNGQAGAGQGAQQEGAHHVHAPRGGKGQLRAVLAVATQGQGGVELRMGGSAHCAGRSAQQQGAQALQVAAQARVSIATPGHLLHQSRQLHLQQSTRGGYGSRNGRGSRLAVALHRSILVDCKISILFLCQVDFFVFCLLVCVTCVQCLLHLCWRLP